jgi:hypothetical protein
MTGGGEYAVTVFASNDQEWTLPPIEAHPTVQLADGTSRVEDVVLRVRNERRALEGRVVDGRGAPIVDARVLLERQRKAGEPVRFRPWQNDLGTRTDEEGRFRFRELVEGTYALKAMTVGGGDVVLQDVAAGAKDVTLVLSAEGRIRGRLVGFGGAVRVRINRAQATPESLVEATVDGDRFHAEGLGSGRWVVIASGPGTAATSVVEVKGSETVEVTMTAGGSGALEGTVVEHPSGAPVAGMRCWAALRAPPEMAGGFGQATPLEMDAPGHYVAARAPAGELMVTCMRYPTYSHTRTTLTLAPDGRAKFKLWTVRMNEKTRERRLRFALDERASVVNAGSGNPLRVGDVVVSVDGVPIPEGMGGEVVSILLSNNRTSTVVVRRGGEPVTAKLDLGE